MNESIVHHERAGEISELNKLATVIQDHNDSLSPIALSMRGFAAGIAQAVRGEELLMETGMATQKEAIVDAHLETTNLIAKYAEFVSTYGLELLPQSSDRADGANTGQIMLTITDPELFVKKIKNFLPAGELATGFTFLQTAIKGYENQIRSTQGDTTDTKNRNLVMTLPDAYLHLDSLSGAIDLSTLKAYAKAAQRAELDQYIEVEKKGLWKNPGKGFGPADWVRDISPELLATEWQDALTVLNQLPTQSRVRADLKNHLLECLTHSYNLIDGLKETYGSTYPFKELKTVLEKITPKLVGNSN